jgi:hypothetical protein
VRLWQANIGKRIIARVPMVSGAVREAGEFELDGVAFPGAEIRLEFLDPVSDQGGGAGSLFPTGRPAQWLEVPGIGPIEATLIDAGMPMVFVEAASLGLRGTELQGEVNGDRELLARAEAIRALGAVAMGLADDPAEVTRLRPHSPKLAFVAGPASYLASDGKAIAGTDIDLLARVFSMGCLHHAMTGTGAVALAVAAAVPGTLVHRVGPAGNDGRIRFGHPSGTLSVGAEVERDGERWVVARALLSRSARCLMEGWVLVPDC